MKYSETLLGHFDAVCGHSNDGLELLRDMLAFFKRRQQIEEEYSKNMTKLARSVLDAKRKSSSSNKGTLWEAWFVMVTEVEEIGSLHRSLTNQITKLLVEPFQNYIKENELLKKSLIAEGTRYKDELQDAFSALKKAKDNHDKMLKELEAAEDKSSALPGKALSLSRSNTPQDLSKAMMKTQMARDKARASEVQVEQCKNICDDRQELYYKRWMPSLLDRFQALEFARIRFGKDTLNICEQMEARLPSRVKAACDRVFKALEDVDPDRDCDIFIDEHTGAEHYSKASVSSLQGSTKSGRISKCSGAVPSSAVWRNRYFILMAPSRLLYCFESENSLKPSDVFHLEGCKVRPIHESLFDRKGVFLVELSPDHGGHKHYFAVETEADLFEWLRFIRACAYSMELIEFQQLHRKILSLSLTIVEGRALTPVDPIRRTANPYCLVMLDRAPEAISSVCSNSLNPLWNERILLDDISPFQTLSIRVVSQPSFPATRIVDIGELEIPYITMERRSIDEWYSLAPGSQASAAPQKESSSIISAVTQASGALLNSAISTASNMMTSSDDAPNTGETMSLRIKTELKTEVVLPLIEYKAFMAALLKEDQVAVRALLDLLVSDRDIVARHIVRVWIASGTAITNLTQLISTEIQGTDDPAIIFRGNSVATKAMDQYMKQISGDYLRTALSHVTKAVLASKQSCEVDLSRLEEGEDVKRNTKRLLGLVRSYLDAIYASLDACPSELRMLFSTIQEQVVGKFPNDPKIRYTAVSGFIFLRLICPAIVAPAVHGIVSESADGRTMRALTLIAKILQNLANIVGDTGKEAAFMGEINAFVADNLGEMRQFIRNLSVVPKLGSSNSSTRTTLELARELESIRGTFEMIAPKIQGQPQLASHPSIIELYSEGTRLGEKCAQLGARARVAVIADSMSPINASSPIPTSPLMASLMREESRGRASTPNSVASPLIRPVTAASIAAAEPASDLDFDDEFDSITRNLQ